MIRWGGEEFLVLFHDCSLADAAHISEKLREAIAALRFEKIPQVTVSLGVAQLRPSETLNEVIERADQALYEAKHSGRNQVKVSE